MADDETTSVLTTAEATITTDGAPQPATLPDGKADASAQPGQGPTPSDYVDFSFPEGASADAETLGKFKDWAKSHNLAQADAQAALDMATDAMTRANAAIFDQWRATQEQWAKTIREDREFGGAKFDENVAVCAKAIDRFGGRPLREALAFTGAGNHPEVIKFVYRIGKSISEGGFVTSNGNAPATNALDRLYPTMTSKE